MFLGKFSRTVNQRNRFPVPSQFKDELAGGAYLMQGFDRNLQVLTARAFQELYQRMMSLNIADPIARQLLRLILGSAQELKADAQSSVLLPADLKDFAGVQQDVFLVGQGDYFEIWSPDLWAQQEAELRDAKTNGSRFSALTLATR